jgi:hypothetical protein
MIKKPKLDGNHNFNQIVVNFRIDSLIQSFQADPKAALADIQASEEMMIWFVEHDKDMDDRSTEEEIRSQMVDEMLEFIGLIDEEGDYSWQ